MYITMLLGFIVMILAYIGGQKNDSKYLKIAFILITVFLSLGYNWGPDVPAYQFGFYEVNSLHLNIFDLDSLQDVRRQGESGWTILNVICFPLGYFGFRMLLFTIENFILYKFVDKYVEKKWQWFTLFIYVFNASEFMVISSPMMRQWLAMCLVVGAFLLYDSGFKKSALLIMLVAPTIHISCVISYLIIPLLNLKFEYTFLKKCVFVVLFLAFSFLGMQLLKPYIVILLANEFDFYQVYLGQEVEKGTGVAAFLKMVLYLSMFLSMDRLELKSRFFVAVTFVSMLFLPLQSMGQLVVRLSYYFSIFSIVAIPLFFAESRWKPILKLGAISFLILLYMYGFWVHFTGNIFHDSMYEYHTIFEAGEWI